MTTTADQSADIAKRLYEEYRKAADLPSGDAARHRMAAIVRAAQEANVWRHFCALRDQVIGATE
jgi:hypothetical protein